MRRASHRLDARFDFQYEWDYLINSNCMNLISLVGALALGLSNIAMYSLSITQKSSYVLILYFINIIQMLLLALLAPNYPSMTSSNNWSKSTIFRQNGVLDLISKFLSLICFFFSVVICIFLLSILEVSLSPEVESLEFLLFS